jgi:hypothetical protein
MRSIKKLSPKKTKIPEAIVEKSVVANSGPKTPRKKSVTGALVSTTSTKKHEKIGSSAATKRLTKNPKHELAGSEKQTAKRAETVPEEVTVPSNAPLRSIEKSDIHRSELSLYCQKSMYRIAIVSGLCFLLIGATFASVNVFEGTAGVKNSALVGKALVEPVLTKLIVLNSVPEVLSEPTKVSFTLTNVYPESVEYYLINEATQKVSESKRADNVQENKYSFLINPDNTPADQYKLHIRYTEKSLLKPVALVKRTEVVARFSIVDKEVAVIEPKPNTNNKELTNDSSNITTQKDKSINDVLPDEIDQKAVEETDKKTVLDKSSEPTVKPVIADAVLVDSPETELKSTQPVVVEELETVKPVAETFSLSIKETTVSGLLTITIKTASFRDLELFARPVTSLKSRFLTRASQRSGVKVFIVNTETFLPNGRYEFYAKGTDGAGKEQTTPSVLITVKNSAELLSVITPVETPKESPSSEKPIEIAETDGLEEPLQKERVFAPINLATQEKDVSIIGDIQAASGQLFKRDAIRITQLLNNYASAKQSGDEMLVKTAQDALTDMEVELANVALVDKKLAGISDDVILDMSEKLSNLRDRVDTFEQIRKEKSGGQSALDTDKDGIPDYDEVNLYRTNPNEPDTDGDGFADGIEIIRGFDPLDDEAEAVIDFESPKETLGLVQSDVLKVDEVIPVINSIVGTNDTSVRTEIRGRGLPNSFVTLYIFSSPTIVTIKTDADGSFVYTLDKELEDGTHDVFVAMTDNTGSIVAQSNPFSFVKEAQAFTPVDSTGGDVIGIDTAAGSVGANSFNIVIGIGVLAFGLILIMLGLSLRIREDEYGSAGGRHSSKAVMEAAIKSTTAKKTT